MFKAAACFIWRPVSILTAKSRCKALPFPSVLAFTYNDFRIESLATCAIFKARECLNIFELCGSGLVNCEGSWKRMHASLSTPLYNRSAVCFKFYSSVQFNSLLIL